MFPVVFLLAVFAASDLAMLAPEIMHIHGLGILQGTERDPDGVTNAVVLSALVGLFQLLIWIPLMICYFIWVYRVAKNAQVIGAEPLRISPGWAVGWYCIPFASLVMPYLSMAEIWIASDPACADDAIEAERADTGLLLPVWWIVWVVSVPLNSFCKGFARDGSPIEDFAAVALPFASLWRVVAAALCVAVVVRLTRRQMVKARSLVGA